MDSNRLLALIGKTSIDVDMTVALSALGVNTTPTIKMGDTNVYVDLPVEGLYLVYVFSDFGNFPLMNFFAVPASVPYCTHNAEPSSPA